MDGPASTLSDTAPETSAQDHARRGAAMMPGRDLLLTADTSFQTRQRLAIADIVEAARLWRLGWTLGWLDIQLRYRGSVLGPFWLTLSTGVMIGALGFLYATLFHMDLRAYLPFLALSIVLWGFIGQVTQDGCVTFMQNEASIRSVRLPFSLYAIRTVVRNILVLAHNIVVIIAVYAIMNEWPGSVAVAALPAILVWLIDSVAASLLLGAFCARFRDIPPIVGSVMQIAFYVTPVIWKPEQLGGHAVWLPLNPFFSLLEIVRAPLLGALPSALVWVSALVYSAMLCGLAWILFVRVRGRLSFWV